MCNYFANYWSEHGVVADRWIQYHGKRPKRHIVILPVYEIHELKAKIDGVARCRQGQTGYHVQIIRYNLSQ